ncbi:MAG: hypothetical protein RL750_145 [Bacteroidota bacterium]|jgi:hypothetical protein
MPAAIFILALWLCNLIGCHKKETGPIYQGRLEITGICSNYTISVISGGLDSNQVELSWTDPTTNLQYTNAFRLKNPCDFPAELKAGDVFYFQLESAPSRNCAQCLAYYPTPSKGLDIRVVTP